MLVFYDSILPNMLVCTSLATQGKAEITSQRPKISSPWIQAKSPLCRRSAVCSAAHPPNKSTSEVVDIHRRLLLSLGLGFGLVASFPTSIASAARLRSLACSHPAVVTFTNSLQNQAIKLYWINYDGDEELFALLPPGAAYTIDTFETHPWRIVDAESGQVIKQYIASRGTHTLELNSQNIEYIAANQGIDSTTKRKTGTKSASTTEKNQQPTFEGFDGVGGLEDEYAQAQVAEIALDHLGGVALLEVEGFPAPLPLPVAALEAAQLFHATGVEFRRPTTVIVWARSLQSAGIEIERSLVTRVVGTTYYGRIVLRLPNGDLQSVDARPSDAISVAMASGAPMYVAKKLAAAQQPGSIENMLGIYKDAESPTGRMPLWEGVPPAPPAIRAESERNSLDAVQRA